MRMSGHTQSGSDLKIPPAASGSLCAADRAVRTHERFSGEPASLNLARKLSFARS